MPIKTMKTGMVLFFAMIVTGCASQNAMKTLPDDVRISILADQARASMASEELETETQDGAATSAEVKLSQEELLFRAHQRQFAAMEQDKVEGIEPTVSDGVNQPDSRKLFARALEMQRSTGRSETQVFNERVSNTQNAEAASSSADNVMDIWNRALTLQTQKAQGQENSVAQVGKAVSDPTTTAAIEKEGDVINVPSLADLYTFTIDDERSKLSNGREMLGEEIYTQLVLRRKGGRLPRRITIGRVEGETHNVLKTANSRADAIRQIIGGDPIIGYDPELDMRAVRIEYVPQRNGNRREQAS